MNARRLVLVLLLAAWAVAVGHATQRTVITSASQLPRRSYQIKGTVLELLADDAQMRRLASELLDNLRKDLETLDIRDHATLQAYHSSIAILHAVLGEPSKARAQIPVMRELEQKPATRLTTGLFLDAWSKTKEKIADESSAAFRQAFEANLSALYVNLPYADIREHVETSKAQSVMMSKELVLGNSQGLQDVLDKSGGLASEGTVNALLGLKFMLDHRLPLKEQLTRVYSRVSDANRATAVPKNDIWTPNEVTLASGDVRCPVVIAVWDSGVDMTALPAANRFVNAGETVDVQDNDQNGHVDDVHGIGWERARSGYTIGTLEDPKGKVRGDLSRLQRLTKGGIDLQAGIQSVEAAELQQLVSSLKREEVAAFLDELNFYTGYMHGTHVAGIALAGNPGARIMAARMTLPYKDPPAYTMAMAEANAGMYGDVVSYFRQHGVRVVNMSWRYSSAMIEATLTLHGVGKDAEQRRAMAKRMFEIERAALYEAIRNAPEILFICGAGNENNNVEFAEYIPAGFDLPNLITVGAVDIEGRKAAFTTEGKSVDFYANGHEIESLVPGGGRLKISGTSMASPQLANLAGKLFARYPDLTVAQVLALIDRGADRSAADPAMKLINPKKTMTIAEGK